MHILLFGGSFNPPHLGHLLVIEQAFELIPGIDELWILPTFDHTFGKTSVDPQHRLEMCRLLIQSCHESKRDRSAIKICSLEIDQHLSGSTYETFQHLKKSHPHTRFSFLMGSDQLPSFHRWINWEKLLEAMHFYVYPRAGHRHSIDFPHMSLLESPTQVITNISSTLIRHRLAHHLPVHRLLPQSVLEYIAQEGLYA